MSAKTRIREPRITKSQNSKREVKCLDPMLDRRLLSYAAAASAAGVGILALAQSSQAQIVYTPTRQTILPHAKLNLDLNNDGIVDFTFTDNLSSCGRPGVVPPECSQYMRQDLFVSGPGSNRALDNASTFVSALPLAAKIGPGGNFGSAQEMEACTTLNGFVLFSGGPWRDVRGRYLGLQFSIQGAIHYGWARLNVIHKANGCQTIAVLTGYAYEATPGRPILAGRMAGGDEVGAVQESPSGSLGRLASGSAQPAGSAEANR